MAIDKQASELEAAELPLEIEEENSAVEQETPPRERIVYTRRFGGFGFRLNLEVALYLLIILFVCLTRFSDLESRALHHDEGVHAFYSDRYFSGGGYDQEPWKHGPFLYHITALSFWLLGVSVTTARIPAALFGLLIVLLPLLMRRQVGRWGALTASFLLAISPMFLYYSRFIREDIFTAVFTLALGIGIMRFIDLPSPRWWFFLMASLALLYCTKEVSYIYTVLFGGFLLGWVCWQFAPRLLLILGGYGLLAAAALGLMLSFYSLPTIPTESPTPSAIQSYIGQLLTHPVFWTVIILLILAVAISWYAFREVAVRRRNYLVRAGVLEPDTSPATALFLPYEPGSVAYAVGWLGRHWRITGLGLLVALAIYSVLYTGFFSSPAQGEVGLVSGLFYWLAQQGVERGAQPWFYYFLILPLYEPLAVLFGTLTAGYILWKATRYGLRRKIRNVLVPASELPEPDPDEELDSPGDASQNPVRQPRKEFIEQEVSVSAAGNSLWPGERRRERHPWFAPLFLVVWAVGDFAVYSWAGEKMPWLTTGLAIPFILLTAFLFQKVWRGLELYLGGKDSQELILFNLRSRVFFWALVNGLIFVGFFAYMVTLNVNTNPAGQTGRGNQALLFIPPLLAFFMVLTASAFTGWRVALYTGAMVVFGFLSIFLLRTGFDYAYTNGDVPVEMGIYTQTSPDVTRVVNEIKTVSVMLPQGRRTPILFDTEGRTPLEFYLRDFPNRKAASDFTQPTLQAAGVSDITSYPLIIAFTDKRDQLTALNDQYVRRTYAFRWWFGEDQYRTFIPAAQREMDFLTNRASQVAVNDATGKLVINKGELMSTQKLEALRDSKGVLDKLYNGNGGNSALLNIGLAIRGVGTELQGDNFARLWRFVIFREVPQAIGSTDFDLYIRKDIIGLYRQYGDLVEKPLDRS